MNTITKLFFLLCSVFPIFAQAQISLISPTGDGGFETGTTFAANGWTAVNGTLTNRVWYVGTGQAGYTGTRCAFIGNSATNVGSNGAARTVHLYRSISIPTGAENITLSFKYKQATADNTFDYLKVHYNANIPVDGTLQTTGTLVTVDPTSTTNPYTSFATVTTTIPNTEAGTTKNLIFTFKCDGVTPNAYGAVDDISLTYTLPTCLSPSSPTVSAITTSSAQISWTAPSTAPANGYEYYVSTSSTTPTAGTTASGSVGAGITTANLSGLTASSNYYFWVRAVCSVSDQSFWVAGPSFYTGYCASTSSGTTYYISSFSTTAGVTNITNASNAISASGYGNFTAQSSSQYIGQTTNFNTIIAGGGTYGLAIFIDWNNDLDFLDTNEKVFTTSSYLSSPIAGGFTIPTGTALGNYRMRVVTNYYASAPLSCNTMSDGETEDYTFTVVSPPTCLAPTALSSNSLTASSAVISWTASTSNPANGYEYYYSTTNTSPTVSTVASGSVAAGVITANLTGLAASTNYYFWVRAICNSGDNSAWSVSSTFYNGYCASTSSGTTYYISSFSTTAGVTNITNATNAISASGYGNFIAQSTSQYEGASVNFNTILAGGGTFGLAIFIDWNNDLDFLDTNEKVYTTSTYISSPIAGNFTIPTGTALGNYRMRVVANYNATAPVSCNAMTNGETEDYTFTVVAIPSCFSPTTLTANSITASSAVISWTASTSNPANGYEYYYSTSNTNPAVGSTPNGSVAAGVTTANLSGLNVSTTYYFWVRAVCSGSDKSAWSSSGTFYTGYCIPTANTNGEGIANFTFGSITNNNSGFSTSGYGNFTNLTAATVSPGASVPITASVGTLNPLTLTKMIQVFIDFNQDLDFLDAGESFIGTVVAPNSTSSFAGNILIPAVDGVNVKSGTTVLRVRVQDNSTSTTTACTPSSNYGETEDYKIDIVPSSCSYNTGVSQLANGENTLTSLCSESSNPYTYYGVNTGSGNQYALAINWGTNAASKTYAEANNKISVFKSSTGNVASGTVGIGGTATLGYYWNVDLTGGPQLSVGAPVSVRFYYLPADLASLSTLVTSTFGGTATSPVWFKTEGIPFDYGSPSVGTTGQWLNMVTPIAAGPYTDPNGQTYIELSGITSFSGGSVSVASGVISPLPINLKTFGAKENGNSNLVTWETSVETNVRSFIVEKSFDLKNWEKLGSLVPSASKRYKLTDENPSLSTYYRLKNIDNDGREDLSSVVVVNRKSGKFNFTNVAPNPTNGVVNLKFETTEINTVQINVLDILGKVVFAQNMEAEKGINSAVLYLNELSAGTYYLSINNGVNSITQRVIKQ